MEKVYFGSQFWMQKVLCMMLGSAQLLWGSLCCFIVGRSKRRGARWTKEAVLAHLHCELLVQERADHCENGINPVLGTEPSGPKQSPLGSISLHCHIGHEVSNSWNLEIHSGHSRDCSTCSGCKRNRQKLNFISIRYPQTEIHYLKKISSIMVINAFATQNFSPTV